MPKQKLPPIFGQTFTKLNKQLAIVFGGVVLLPNKLFSTVNTCMSLDIRSNNSFLLQNRGAVPSPRIGHSSCKVQENTLATFGGSTVQGQLVDNKLYLMRLEGEEAMWSEVQT